MITLLRKSIIHCRLPMMQKRHRNHFTRAFSLVEVVLAIGITAFSFTGILGVYSVLTGQAKDNIDRRYQLQSIEALRSTLNRDIGFEQAYSNARDMDPMEFIYVTFRADASDPSGQPTPNGNETRSVWLLTSDVTPAYQASLDAAREGRWIRARMALSSASPLPADALPATTAAYPHGVLIFAADIAEVAHADVPFPPAGFSTFPISVIR